MSVADNVFTIVVSGTQLALLKKLDFPCSERVLESAQQTEEGIELAGSKADFVSLAPFLSSSQA